MKELEEDVNRAIEAFLAAIMRAVERAAVAALRASFAGASQTGDAHANAEDAASRGGHALRRDSPPPAARPPTPADSAALAGRIIACTGAHPGCTVMQLAPYVGVHEATLRRHMHRLAREGLIRIEEHATTRFGGQATRVYYVIAQTDAAPPEADAQCAEAA